MRANKAIVVDVQTFAALKERSLPFETPNGLLRRLLGLPPMPRERPGPRPKKNLKKVG